MGCQNKKGGKKRQKNLKKIEKYDTYHESLSVG